MNVINEDRMLRLIHNFFESPQTLVSELVQNAVRAKAKNIEITIANGRLCVTDDGEGCNSIAPLLTLAESSWDEEVEQNQQPAGWGLFVLYCLSKEVEISSKFGTLKFDTELYLQNPHYRGQLLLSVDPELETTTDMGEKVDGFRVSATLKDRVVQGIEAMDKELLRFFPINIGINGKHIKRTSAGEEANEHAIKTTYMGNDLFIRTNLLWSNENPITDKNLAVIWYGMPVMPGWSRVAKITLDVTQGAPLTPVLPFRTSIKQDEKFQQFMGFVRGKMVEHCIDKINSTAVQMDKPIDSHTRTAIRDLMDLMYIMVNIATQEELDRLEYFYVREAQPYYCGRGRYSAAYSDEIVAKGNKVFSDDIEPYIEKPGGEKGMLRLCSYTSESKYDGDYERIHLPEDTIIQRSSPVKSPGWLEIDTRIHKITIRIPENGERYDGNLSWFKADIVSDIDLGVIGIDSDCGLDTTTVYYSEKAGDIWGIQESIEDYLLSDDGDSYETQQEWIAGQITEDIQNINNNYDGYSLLEGFRSVSGINTGDIENIAIGLKEITLTLKGGVEKVLLLA